MPVFPLFGGHTVRGDVEVIPGSVTHSYARVPRFSERAKLALDAERANFFHWIPVAFGTGIGLYFWLPAEPALWATFAVLIAASIIAIACRETVPLLLACGILTLAAGFSNAALRTSFVTAPVIEAPTGRIEVTGRVELVEPRRERGHRITLQLTKAGNLPEEKIPLRARVRTLKDTGVLEPGDTIRMMVRLAAPAPPAHPGAYDFARAAWYQGIGAVGYALSPPERVTDSTPPQFWFRWQAAIERLRQSISAKIREALPGETGAIAAALITGERGAISPETNSAFRDSGLFHVLSISGLHMVVMAGAVFYLIRLLFAAIPFIALSYPIKKWAAFGAILAALAYLLISGGAFATLRSYIMITIMFWAVMMDRPAIAMRNVAVSALIIMAFFPESVLDAGFQMSFAAVVALVTSHEALSLWRTRRGLSPPSLIMRPLHSLLGIGVSTMAAGVAVAPLAAYHFHTSQQFALVANLIAIPICNLVVMPAALMTLILMPLGLHAVALSVMGTGIEVMVQCAKFAAGLPGAVMHIPAIPFGAFLMIIYGGLWFCLWGAWWRSLGLAAVALGLALTPFSPRPDLLVGRDGQLVAVRNNDGSLSALSGRFTAFELKRWLEHDGDGRTADAASKGETFRCDRAGCLTEVGGLRIAISRHPASLEQDCRTAAILIVPFPVPKGCTGPKAILDYPRLRADGTHAIYVEGGHIQRIETVAEARGSRPWTRFTRVRQKEQRDVRNLAKMKPPQSMSVERDRKLSGGDELHSLSAQSSLRPEIEDEDSRRLSDLELLPSDEDQ